MPCRNDENVSGVRGARDAACAGTVHGTRNHLFTYCLLCLGDPTRDDLRNRHGRRRPPAPRRLGNPRNFDVTWGLSTIDAGVELMQHICGASEDSRDAICVFCDLSKAFDCFYHETLIGKQHHYEVKGRILDLLKSCLSNRVEREWVATTAVRGFVMAAERPARVSAALRRRVDARAARAAAPPAPPPARRPRAAPPPGETRSAIEFVLRDSRNPLLC
ncbi:hypothetical protein EVAR_75235_1 [Eumeta japonica]|uniref:Reverse transcriptase domain-containing protein n=1 Tax=Eumeta variegata TaxID=151549 RepID=A0A4C1V878_EUMVA|nr:hypothetical protein EVAR_75235_1 [Eumeta japonica]